MPDPVSTESRAVERARQQIHRLVQEIAELSDQDLGFKAYFTEFLPRVVDALAAVGGAVWKWDKEGRIHLVQQVNLADTLLDKEGDHQQHHGQLIANAVNSPEGLLVLPHAGLGNERSGANPTELLLVLMPVAGLNEATAVVEIFQRPAAQAEVRQGYLKFLSQMCDHASQWAKGKEFRQLRKRDDAWIKLNAFLVSIHAGLDLSATSYAIANEARQWLECDRVSVALMHGKRCRMEAISGQDEIERRSDLVIALQRLTDRVVAVKEPLWYPADMELSIPPQLEDVIHEYVDLSHSKTIVILPLHQQHQVPARSEQEESEPASKSTLLGALILEQMEDVLSHEQLRVQLDLLLPHCQLALANAKEHEGVFMLPLLRRVGKLRWFVTARRLPKTVLASISLFILLLILIFVPAPFRLEGRGVLQPVQQRDVFVEVDGIVTNLHVQHGDFVQEGDLLLVLDNPDIEVQLAAISGELQSTKERIAAIERMRFQRHIDQTEKNRLAGELLQLEQELISLEAQSTLLRTKYERLRIHSPATGNIVTWNVTQKLQQRPVTVGQVLLTVANPRAAWELEVFMPEKRMGHVMAAQAEVGGPLSVEYVVATDPTRRGTGLVREIHELAELHEEHGHAVSLLVDVNAKEIQDPRPGATIIAHVDCGTRSLGYVWLHEVFEYIESRILFNLW